MLWPCEGLVLRTSSVTDKPPGDFGDLVRSHGWYAFVRSFDGGSGVTQGELLIL